MTQRIRDLRVLQAQQYGVIVGLPRAFAEAVAIAADILSDLRFWSDVTFMFPEPDEPVQAALGLWRVPLPDGWGMLFKWDPVWGAVEFWLDEPGGGPAP